MRFHERRRRSRLAADLLAAVWMMIAFAMIVGTVFYFLPPGAR